MEPPGDFNPHSLAEFAEAVLFLSDDDYLSASEFKNYFLSGSQPSDAEVELALQEIRRRSESFGRLYPFVEVDRGVMLDRSPTADLYACLMLLSLKNTNLRRVGDYQRSDPLFDSISRLAFRNNLGSTADSLIFGWPPRDDRPAKFSLAVAWVATKIGVALSGATILDIYKDAGVDVIAWKRFPDPRNGFVTLIAQNTVQFDFRNKPRDLMPSLWRKWLALGAEPIAGFAIPFSLPVNDPWWELITTDIHVVLDRGRLMHELKDEDPTGWPDWVEIQDFVREESVETDDDTDKTITLVRPRKGASSALAESQKSGAN